MPANLKVLDKVISTYIVNINTVFLPFTYVVYTHLYMRDRNIYYYLIITYNDYFILYTII